MANVRPFEWFLGSFSTGEIINSVPMIEIGGGEIDLSVDNEDTAEIEISTGVAPSNIRNNWSSYYKEVLHYAGCKNIETGDIVWAGMINKITPDIKKQSLSFQLVNPKEYMQARIVGENFGTTVENPNAGITFTGATWVDIVGKIVKRCFAPISGSVPQPPNILGNVTPEPSDGEVSFEVLFSDALSYKEAMQQAIDESGEDLETRFTARHVEAEGRIVWDFNIGTMDSPHINESSNLEISIDLINDEDRFKISEFQNEIDSTELFNSFYISSKAGDSEKNTGMDLKNSVTNTTGFPILLEKYYNPGVELTESQINKQLNAYISNGMDYKRTGSISLELEDHRFKTWASNYLGRVISFTGFDNTLSAGYTSKLRIVGVRLDTLTGRVILDLMTKMQKYPRLPRKKNTENKKDRSKSPSNRLIRQRDIKNIKPGGGTTVPPWEGGGTYPPTDGGYGSDNGSGSNTVKDDDSPYRITNYGKKASDPIIDRWGSSTQTQTNLCFTLEETDSLGGVWFELEWDGTTPQTVENSLDNGLGRNLANVDVGSCYLSEGTMMSFDGHRFNVDFSDVINDILGNLEKWGVNKPTYIGNQFSYIWKMNFGLHIVAIRDSLYFAISSEITLKYESYVWITNKTFLFSKKITEWNDLGQNYHLPYATIPGSITDGLARVGDYMIVGVETAYYVNNFSTPEAVNMYNWYSIPNVRKMGEVDLVTLTKIVIGKVKINGNWEKYLIKQGSDWFKGVYGIRLTDDSNAPVIHPDGYWKDISEFFPVPASAGNRSITVDSISGFLTYTISGSNWDLIVQEIYMQGADGVWHKLEKTELSDTKYFNIFQYGNWIYNMMKDGVSGSGYYVVESYRLEKTDNWAEGSAVGSVPPASP